MKRQAFTLLQAVLLLLLVGIIAAVLFPIFARPSDGHGRSNCQSNLKQIGLGFVQYVQDYNEKFPILTTEQGWVGALQPYVKSTNIFICPQERVRIADNLTDYWFNRRLAGVETKKIGSAASTFLSGDGEASDDPNISLQLLPPRWLEKDDSPAHRHLEGANYGFADGHVKWFKAQTIVAPEKEKDAPTFLIR